MSPNEIRSYFDRLFAAPPVKIQPGQWHVTAEDRLITTLLGSCVAVCLRDRVSGVGGMNHFMLPGGSRDFPSARYGAHAMEMLLQGIDRAGGERSRLEAKVFGAGRIIRTMADVGRKNAEFALNYLRAEGIPVTAQDIGEAFPRKVVFSPFCGKAYIKHLRSPSEPSDGGRQGDGRISP